MARLPTSVDGGAPNGAVTSGRSVDLSGFGNAIQNAGQELQRYDQARKAADNQVAGREVEAAQQSYALDAGVRAEAYDGRDPGFAARELSAFDAHMAPVLARTDVSDGVRDSLTLQTRDLRARVGAQAIAVETRARGARNGADRDAADQAAAVQGLLKFQSEFDGLNDTRREAWDGASPGYAEGSMADFTAAQDAAMQGLSPAAADRLRPMLQSKQVSLQATAMAAEDEGRDAGTMRTVSQGLQALIGRARRDPAVALRFDEEAAPILAAAPAPLRQRLELQTRQAVMGAALTTRIEAGAYDDVQKEIDQGAYDWMDPGQIERARDAVKTARANGVIQDAQKAADLDAAIPADLRAILTGSEPDPALIVQARLIGGDALAVKVETDQKAALQIRPFMARVRGMTADQAQAELETLQADAGTPVGAQVVQMATQLIANDRQLRSDPAAWAATPVGPGDLVAEQVRDRWRAFSAAPSEATAQAYARATLTAQAHGGIPSLQHRVLDSGTADAWVHALDADGAPADALAALSQRAALFGGLRPAVLRELQAAGLKDADLGAVTQYSGARLDLYVRGRGLKPNEAVPEKDTRDDLDTGLRTAMAPWLRAIGSTRGGPAASEAARVLAYGMVQRGASVDDAVRMATQPMAEAYDFVDTWAVPKAAGVETRRVRDQARETVRGLIDRNGAGLYAPASATRSPEQSRRLYADMVREHATWRTLADDSGLELVMPDAQGRMARVRDAAGHGVVRNWTQLNRDTPRRSGVLG